MTWTSLAPAARRVQRDAELLAVRAQRLELGPRERVGDRPRERRDVVIHRRDREIRPAHAATGEPQPVERLRRRHLVDQVQIDVEKRRLAWVSWTTWLSQIRSKSVLAIAKR